MNLSKIKELRKEKGLSQRKLADMLNVSPSYIQKIESNKKNPSISTLKKISNALNIEVSVLLNNDISDANKLQNNDYINELQNKIDDNLYMDSKPKLPNNIPLELLMEFSEYIDEGVEIAHKLEQNRIVSEIAPIHALEALYRYKFKHLKNMYEYNSEMCSKLESENQKLQLALGYLELENSKLREELESWEDGSYFEDYSDYL